MIANLIITGIKQGKGKHQLFKTKKTGITRIMEKKKLKLQKSYGKCTGNMKKSRGWNMQEQAIMKEVWCRRKTRNKESWKHHGRTDSGRISWNTRFHVPSSSRMYSLDYMYHNIKVKHNFERKFLFFFSVTEFGFVISCKNQKKRRIETTFCREPGSGTKIFQFSRADYVLLGTCHQTM